MSTATVVVPAPRSAWAELVADDPDVLPSQSPAWVDAAVATGRYDDVSRFYDLPEGAFVLPMLRRRVVGRALRLEGSFPEAWGFGGLVGAGLGPAAVRFVLDDLVRDGAARVVIRPNPLHAEVWAEGAPDLVVRRDALAHVIDLAPGIDAVWDGFSQTRRRNIRRANRADLEIECDTTGRLLPEFHGLLQASFDRWAGFQQEPLVVARWRGNRRDPLDKFRAIAATLGDRLCTWIARVDGIPAAGMLVLRDRNAHYTRGAMDKELAGPRRANDLLHWLAIQDAAAAGCRAYHMGESGRDSSLARFKEGFGARAVPYARYEIERWPIGRTDQVLRRAAKRLLRMRNA